MLPITQSHFIYDGHISEIAEQLWPEVTRLMEIARDTQEGACLATKCVRAELVADLDPGTMEVTKSED